jgi:hypothetical protein
VDAAAMRRAGYGAAALAGAATFAAFRSLLDRILLSRSPNYRRLFDRLSPADFATVQPLTLRRAWALLGPTATRGSLREFWRGHGMRCVSAFLAAMWAVVLTPIAHAKAEAAYAVRGEPMAWGRERRAREDAARHEAQAIARRGDEGLQAALRARDEAARGNTLRSGATTASSGASAGSANASNASAGALAAVSAGIRGGSEIR